MASESKSLTRQELCSMPKEIISTPEAPQSSAYSQAVKVGDTIYVAGTTGVDVTTGQFAGATVKEQARQSLLNCQAILRAAGAELSDAVMVHTLLLRPEDVDELTEVFDEIVAEVRPPRRVGRIGVDRPGLLVSIAMVAVTD
jgi:2-iminobutanoate/2-iminopropanoate deaminase